MAPTATTAAGVADFVGYGTANDFESTRRPGRCRTPPRPPGTRPAPTPTTTAPTSPPGAPDPQNSAVGAAASPPPVKHDPRDPGRRAPLAARRPAVTDVTGVVTAARSNGFWLQDPTPGRRPGDQRGPVRLHQRRADRRRRRRVERRRHRRTSSGPAAAPDNLTTTELTTPTVTGAGHRRRRSPVTLVGPGGRVPPTEVDRRRRRPATSRPPACSTRPATASTSTSRSRACARARRRRGRRPDHSFGELPVVPAVPAPRPHRRGGIVLRWTTPTRSGSSSTTCSAPTPCRGNVGDTLAGLVIGVARLRLRQLQAAGRPAPPTAQSQRARPRGDRGRQRTTSWRSRRSTWRTSTRATRSRSSTRWRGSSSTNLRSPDILALEEVQDNNGAGRTTARSPRTQTLAPARRRDRGGRRPGVRLARRSTR